MVFVALVPAILCFVTLAAHYLRGALSIPLQPLNLLLVVLCLATPFLFLIRARAILRGIQLLLLLATAEWLATAWDVLRERIAEHRPFRAAMIVLGSVALANLISALLLQLPAVRRRYPQRSHLDAEVSSGGVGMRHPPQSAQG